MAALAFPPLLAPSLPNATAAGFFSLVGGGWGFGGSWVVIWVEIWGAGEVEISDSTKFLLLARVGMGKF